MQSHKNQVHRLILIDRVLQQNTFRKPEGATRESIEQSVRELIDNQNDPSSIQSFEHLWKGRNAFWRDLNFIQKQYPQIAILDRSSRLWKYQTPGSSIFPRFGSIETDVLIKELILLLDYIRNIPLAKDLDTDNAIETLEAWFGITPRTNKAPSRHFHHQFASEDFEIFSTKHIKTLHYSLERHIVEIQYASSRYGDERHLEFHPWEFHQSEGRWYITGYISADLGGNYPALERSNFPGLVLKLSQIKKVSVVPNSMLLLRKEKKWDQNRHTFISRNQFPSILDFSSRIGTGGWDRSLSSLKGKAFKIEFRITHKAAQYFDSSIQGFAKRQHQITDKKWLGLYIAIDNRPSKKRKTGTLSVLNRELISALRSFGDQIEILEPMALRTKFGEEALKTSFRYSKDYVAPDH